MIQPRVDNYGFLKRCASITRLMSVPALIASLVVLVLNIAFYDEQNHFFRLAQSFVAGVPHLQGNVSNILLDIAPYHGKYYVPMSPFPAILFMPFAALPFPIPPWFIQSALNIAFGLFAAVIAFKISRRYDFSKKSSLVLASALLFSSPIIGILMAPNAWYLAHIIAVTAVLGALYEYLTRRRWWLIGCLMGITLGTRTPAGLGVIFFIGEILRSNPAVIRIIQQYQQRVYQTYFSLSNRILQRNNRMVEPRDSQNNTSGSMKTMVVQLATLLVPFVFILLALGNYNVARFESFTESGYAYQNVGEDGRYNRELGLFSPKHIPVNMYYLLIAPPILILEHPTSRVLTAPYIAADPWGMSLLLTSPYLILLILARNKETMTRLLLLTSAIVLLPILTYYGVGFSQYGYRYALDCFPFLFLAFVIEYRKRAMTRTSSASVDQKHEIETSRAINRAIQCSIVLNTYFALLLIL